MASTSSSSSLRSSQQNHTRFDVFLSFRGEDTRLTFTDHLFHGLKRAGLRTFRDDDEIERGEELKPEIERAIIESRASIVVLSENYANSKWCLDELCLILDQRRKNNHFVLPVFYHVDPSDVRNQRGSFAIQVEEGVAVQKKRKVVKGVQVSKWTNDNVSKWKAALIEVANLSGMTLSGTELDFITKIADMVKSRLDLKLQSPPTFLTGMETRAQAIDSWLKDEQSGTNFRAICGMGGSGKTTLAQYIYDSNKLNFECSSFVEEIGKRSKPPCGLIDIQKQLLGDVKRGKSVMISTVSEGIRKIKEILEMKRVLIVLDDIDEHEQLDALLGGKVFHTQSKILITTRLLDIYAWSISRMCSVHKLELLNDLESLELFSWHAFGSKSPMAGFEKLALQFTQYCEGNPLALKVLGSSLFIRVENPSKINSLLELWACRLKSLSPLKGNVHSKIQGVLRRSFDSLPYDSEKELLLHISCFFVDDLEETVVGIFQDDLHAKSGIMTLVNRSLLTISDNGILKMHQLLQDMGRRIVREESNNLAERSKIWCSDEAYNLLIKGDGSKRIEGLSLDIQEIQEGTKQPLAALKAGSLAEMKNLKLLKLFGDAQLVRPYTNFPDLRWLRWYRCNLKTIPSGLLTSRLVSLQIGFGKLEKFEEPPTVLASLKMLELRHSYKLVSICGFSLLPKLEILYLGGCRSLTHVCNTIGDLKSLYNLQLTGCVKLFEASSNKKYVNHLERLKACFVGGGIQEQQLLSLPQSLKVLYLDRCDLQFNNDIGVVFRAQSFLRMNLRGNLFEYLPDNIDLKVLRVLDLVSCPNLKALPCLPSTLQELYITWCTSLERITFQSGRFSLLKFGYASCFKLSEIQGLFKLVSIENIDEADLENMHWIKAYKDHMVELVGDIITKGRSWPIQMLYEYGIRNIYLQGIKDQSIMMTYEYTSSSDFLSFHVPLHPKKHTIKGLNVSCLYRTLGEDKDLWLLFAIVTNITKGLTWAYNPVVYCKPKIDEDVVWLSYWPIGNILDDGDEVYVEIICEKGLIVSGCGASLLYVGGEVGEEEKFINYTKDKEVIGGDLSEYEVITGGYYLCRRDLAKSTTLAYLKALFGDNIHYTESQGWRKSRTTLQIAPFDPKALTRTFVEKIEVGVSLNGISEIDEINKAVSSITGVESVSVNKEIGRMYVAGRFYLEEVATCVEKFEIAKILCWDYISRRNLGCKLHYLSINYKYNESKACI